MGNFVTIVINRFSYACKKESVANEILLQFYYFKVGPRSGRNGDWKVFVFAKNVANGPEKAKTWIFEDCFCKKFTFRASRSPTARGTGSHLKENVEEKQRMKYLFHHSLLDYQFAAFMTIRENNNK